MLARRPRFASLAPGRPPPRAPLPPRACGGSARRAALALLGVLCLATACFRGGEREKEPPPGYAGGLCLAPTATVPEPHCVDGSFCNAERGFCYDPADPCRGFFCGGSDRGTCVPLQDPDGTVLPSCTCFAGYNTERYELICCPEQPGVDDVCGVIGTSNTGGGTTAGPVGGSTGGPSMDMG